jgi:threonine dehydrogenase-like Zn-dependent dehydrogenase
MVTHQFKLDDIRAAAYDLFTDHRDRVFKVTITP